MHHHSAVTGKPVVDWPAQEARETFARTQKENIVAALKDRMSHGSFAASGTRITRDLLPYLLRMLNPPLLVRPSSSSAQLPAAEEGLMHTVVELMTAFGLSYVPVPYGQRPDSSFTQFSHSRGRDSRPPYNSAASGGAAQGHRQGVSFDASEGPPLQLQPNIERLVEYGGADRVGMSSCTSFFPSLPFDIFSLVFHPHSPTN